MKLIARTCMLLIALNILEPAQGQGRVVINEYMPWTVNNCGTTTEFVELMNFGPGPINIGCYILTDGDFSVTIPANTILQPGEFFVLAGQDSILAPCANINQNIKANLNWNSCGCTSGAIPTTGDGFFTDGGSANEQVVLLDPTLKIVDAVVRSLPVEPSSLITTSGTGCTAQSFDLDLMTVKYEALGMSTGRGNSFARRLDGDCGWIKDPQQSATTTNNTSGDVSDASYSFERVNGMDCDVMHGSVRVTVTVSDYAQFFPVKYTLAFDSNDNGVLDFNDQYTTGADSTAPDVYITNLPVGNYRLTVESNLGCSLRSFDFQILRCSPVLDAQLVYFRMEELDEKHFQLKGLLNGAENLAAVELQKGINPNEFQLQESIPLAGNESSLQISVVQNYTSSYTYYRLKMTQQDGRIFYSQVLKAGSNYPAVLKAWPNPVRDQLFAEIRASREAGVPYSIYDMAGKLASTGVFRLKAGTNNIVLTTSGLAPGMYQVLAAGDQPFSFRFVKH